jgi:hypothetical protein
MPESRTSTIPSWASPAVVRGRYPAESAPFANSFLDIDRPISFSPQVPPARASVDATEANLVKSSTNKGRFDLMHLVMRLRSM